MFCKVGILALDLLKLRALRALSKNFSSMYGLSKRQFIKEQLPPQLRQWPIKNVLGKPSKFTRVIHRAATSHLIKCSITFRRISSKQSCCESSWYTVHPTTGTKMVVSGKHAMAIHFS